MEFKFIDNEIGGINIDLEVLRKDARNYSISLFQHTGVFKAGENRFGNEGDCSSKFSAFLDLAKEQNVSIALTPEYSCPWQSLTEVVQNQDKWPNPNKIWAICCESITIGELTSFSQHNASDNILIHFDQGILTQGVGVLLDPICYLFKAQVDDIEKLIVLIQFKTHHMGVWSSTIERDKLIWGNHIYVLRNRVDSIYLFTLICSEAASFSISQDLKTALDDRWDEQPYLILSPQLNPKPSHDYFRSFRKGVLQYPNKDIISLNWGQNTGLFGLKEPWIPLSKSSIVFRSTEIDYQNLRRFSNNHLKGLYYVNKKVGKHAYYLNPSEEVFIISHQKPASSGVPESLSRRTGPEVTSVLRWNEDTDVFEEIEEVSDEFRDWIVSLNCTSAALMDNEISFIDKERLITISSGQAKSKGDDLRWHNLENLETFIQDDNELVQRLTYIYDDLSDGLRRSYIECIDRLNDVIIPDETIFPDALKVFKGNCDQVMFYNQGGYDYRYNLVTNDGQNYATVSYIGRTNEEEAYKILHRLQGIFEKSDQSRKRVVVWYHQSINVIGSVSDNLPPMITDDTTTDPNSILKV